MKIQGSKAREYKIGPLLAGTVNVSYKENTIPFSRRDVAAVFEQLHRIFYKTERNTHEHH